MASQAGQEFENERARYRSTAGVEDRPATLPPTPPSPSTAMSTIDATSPLDAVSHDSSAASSPAISHGNSLRGTALSAASSTRIRKGLLTRAGSEAEDRVHRNVSGSSYPNQTTDDDEEDETITSDSGPMPRRFASQKRGNLAAGTRQTSQSSLSSTGQLSDAPARAASGSGYVSGSRSGSGEASEGHLSTGSASLERAMSISSVSSVNSTSSLEAAPFRQAPRGNVRLGFGGADFHGHMASPPNLPINAHDNLTGQLHVPELEDGLLDQYAPPAASTSAPTISTTIERTKRVPKPASDAWMYRVGPGMRTSKGRGSANILSSSSSAIQPDAEDGRLSPTPSKRSRDALRQKFVQGASRVGVQSSITTQLGSFSPTENTVSESVRDSSDDDTQHIAAARTPLPRSSSYFGTTPHSANSITAAFPQPSLTPVPADFRTSSVTNAPLVVPKYPENLASLSRASDQPISLAPGSSTMQPLLSLEDSMDALHPRLASTFVTSRRRSSATQRPIPIRAESSDDAFDRVASPGLNVDDPSAFGASPAEPALFTLSPSSPATTSLTGRSAHRSSITSLTTPRPTPAEIVRLEAQAGIASLPATPSEPSPAPSGYDSGLSNTGIDSILSSTLESQQRRDGAPPQATPQASESTQSSSEQRMANGTSLSAHVKQNGSLQRMPDPAVLGDDATSLYASSVSSVPDRQAINDPLPLDVVPSQNGQSVFPRSPSPASQLARSPDTIRAGINTRLGPSMHGMSPMSASSLRSPRIGPFVATAPTERSRSPATARSPVDFHFGETLGEGSYSTVLEAWDLLSGPSPKQAGVIDPDAVSASAAMVGAGSARRKRRQIDVTGRKSYAIKVLDKVHILKQGKQKYVTVEREALSRMIRHPGVVTLFWTFQDRESLYFVLELAKHGELLESIRRYGSFNKECARYYAAQLAETIDALHKAGVVHRDIKPENILLDSKNRIKVTDFGSAKIVHAPNASADSTVPEKVVPSEPSSANQVHRAASFVGTAEYVSPELLIEKAEAAGKPADWWAFGCVVFQMLAGRPPFKGVNEYQTLQKVKHREFSFPAGFAEDAQDLVDHLLVLNPGERLTAPQIKAHRFFEGVRFDKLWDIEPAPMATGLAKPAPKAVQPQGESADMTDFSFDEGFISSGDSQAYAGDTQSINTGEARSGPEDIESHPNDVREGSAKNVVTPNDDVGTSRQSVQDGQASTSSAKHIEPMRNFANMSLDSVEPRKVRPDENAADTKAGHNSIRAAASKPFMTASLRRQGSPVINGSLTGVRSWAALLLPQEMMLYSLPVLQKTGAGKMFTKRRQLVLTDFPRLLCVKETAAALKVKSEVILAVHTQLNTGGEAGFEKISSGLYRGSDLAEEGDQTIAQLPETSLPTSPNQLVAVDHKLGKSFVVRTSAQNYFYEVLTGDASGIVKHIRDATTAN